MRLAAFVPQDRRRALAQGADLPARTRGAALFVDLAGFTALTESLAEWYGVLRGAEELSRVLAAVYEDLIGAVDASGGSVIGFSGDAITCWFEGDDGATALHTAHAMQRSMAAGAGIALQGGRRARLGVKAAVAVGPVRRMVVGDPEIQRIDVIAGRTLEALAAAEHAAATGEVVLALTDGAPRIDVAEVREVDGAGIRVGVVAPVGASVVPPPAAAPAVLDDAQAAPWVLGSLRDRILRSADSYLAGFRPAAALFQSFRGIDFDEDPAAAEKLDAYVCGVQRVVTRAGGTLVQLTIGDKGSYLYAAFGAPTAHDDDAARAVAVAQELARPAQPFITEVRTGVTFGQMFTGTYGSQGRCTYGVLGPRTNLAARLMGKAAPGEVLCNDDVARHAARAWRFERRGEVAVKGVATPVPVFVPLGTTSGAHGAFADPIGRVAERQVLDEALREALAGRTRWSGLLGDAGSGKSRLLAYAAARAEAEGARVLSGVGQLVARTSAYRPWREVLRSLLDLPAEADQRTLQAALERFDPTLAPRAELLTDVLWPERVRSELQGGERKPLVIGAVTALLRSALQRDPLVIVLDDLQWFDGLSIEVVEALRAVLDDAGRGLWVLLGARPDETGAAPDGVPSDAIVLGPMADAEVLGLAAQYLGVRDHDLPAPVATLVRDRAAGNPLLVEVLLDDMLERGTIRVLEGADGAKCVLDSADAGNEIPATAQGLVLSRLDRLPPEAQLTLKTSAVIGKNFTLPPLSETLQDVAAYDARQTETEVGVLNQRGFVDPDAAVAHYHFRQALTHEVAYASLLFAQRQELHRKLAEWYLARPDPDTARVAYHAYHAAIGSVDADLLDRAGDALQRHADHLFGLGSYRDVADTCRLALHLLPDEPDWQHRRARLQVRLGVVSESLSAYEDATASLEAGLRAARAADASEVVTDALNALCLVATRRGDFAGAERYAREALAAAESAGFAAGRARARSRLGILAMYRGDLDVAATEYQAALDLAEVANDTVTLASCLSNLALVRIYQDRPHDARPLLEQAMEVARQLDNRHLRARFVTNLGLADEKAGDLPAADTHYREGLATFEDLGARQEATVNVLNLGEIAMRRGEPEMARASYRRALHESLAVGALPVALSAVGGLAWAAARTGSPERAVELLGLVTSHPARDTEVEQHAAMVAKELDGALTTEARAAAHDRGRAIPLEEIARQEPHVG